MSALAAHARAMRVLGGALHDEADLCQNLTSASSLRHTANAHLTAASRLESEIRLNAGRQDSGPVELPSFTKGDGQ